MMSLPVACTNAQKKGASAPIFPEVIAMTCYLTSTAHGDSDDNSATECFQGISASSRRTRRPSRCRHRRRGDILRVSKLAVRRIRSKRRVDHTGLGQFLSIVRQ
jgi:hypothetical protein